MINQWLKQYNQIRPHQALRMRPPAPETISKKRKVTGPLRGGWTGKPVAMGYIASQYTEPGTGLYAEVRGTRMRVQVATMPFITPGYKRG